MTQIWKENSELHCSSGVGASNMIVVEEYVADNLGAPFKVVLCNAVQQEVCPTTNKIIATYIPNQTDLIKEVALARSLCDRKFSGREVKFLRKAIGLKAIELAELLGITPEHLSRCENNDRVLSNSAEKLFRVIVLKRRYDRLELADALIEKLSESSVDQSKVSQLRDALSYYRECVDDLEKAIFESRVQSVFDLEDRLCFSFGLRPTRPKGKDPADDEQWRHRKIDKKAA